MAQSTWDSAGIEPSDLQRSDSALERDLEAELNGMEPEAAIASDQWQCEACTTFNAETEIACTMCFTTRMTAKDVAVTWEWQAEGENWIPYDLATCLQVEDAYKQLDRISLTSGFFAAQPGVYEILFEWEGRPTPEHRRRFGRRRRRSFCPDLQCWQMDPCLLHQAVSLGPETGKCLDITQFNLESGNVRKARRIGDDDSSIFVSVDKLGVLVQTDKCGVCQEMFYEDDETCASVGNICEQDVVRLAKCKNHYFHRDCISQWVKLKHTCPFCKTPI